MTDIEKAREIWLHLHQAEQLAINDPNYYPHILNGIALSMHRVETLQKELGDD